MTRKHGNGGAQGSADDRETALRACGQARCGRDECDPKDCPRRRAAVVRLASRSGDSVGGAGEAGSTRLTRLPLVP
jgi:hypothetical protein